MDFIKALEKHDKEYCQNQEPLSKPKYIDNHTLINNILKASSVSVFVSLLPQIELILAVGLKLSTKSDIKLPRSYTQRQNDNKTKVCVRNI